MGRALRETDTIIVVLFFGGGMREKETSSSLCQHARRKRERDPVSVSCRHFAAAARGHATATKIRKNIYSSWFSNFASPGNGTSTVYFPLALLCDVRRNSKGI